MKLDPGGSVSVAVGEVPEVGQLVRVRGQQWVVAEVRASAQPADPLAAAVLPGRTIVELSSVADDDLGANLAVVWEVEPGRQVLPVSELPVFDLGRLDAPRRLGAFLDAVRWGAVTSADERTLQAPFRSGIDVETHQLEPVARALRMPRVNLLIADDVGLGKTIEAGLVAQEMLLRHRARRIMVVCPAPLTGKWRDEMLEKFGLDFTVVDTAALRQLRRSHGLAANPFRVYPRIVISLAWLRTPRVQRLLDEVLTPQTRLPGFVDLLIVDEAHHCAPPAPTRGRGYAVDSHQTQAVRRLAEHSQHRLFLSATPHNGYANSWQALLEMLDPQRFTRGLEPDKAALDEVMIRRLKDEITNPDGTPKFPGRDVRAVEVTYPPAEREIHALLSRYLDARTSAKATGGSASRTKRKAADLVALLLKKRLFSSPAAFAATLAWHAESARRPRGAAVELPTWLEDLDDWDDDLTDDESGAESERVLHDQTSAHLGGLSAEQDALLEEMLAWAERNGSRSDAKAAALVEELKAICRPDGEWSDQRVIIFTEYVTTQQWLADLLDAYDLGGERLGLLHGGMDPRRRDHLKAAFQAKPSRDPVRILLATDAASEGIDLQRHCHRMIHYDIPFNPNRLEQRIGRVDRHGQKHKVEVVHFVGAGWERAPEGSYENDLEFLSRVATKVAQERRDLGSINPVLAAAVEARMLGRPTVVDPATVTAKTSAAALRAEQLLRARQDQLRRELDRLRDQLTTSVNALHVRPENVRRVIDTALELAEQPPLADAPDAPGLVAPPSLRRDWARTVLGLADPLDGHLRSMTFDPAKAVGNDDVVLAHLEHPLVAQSTRLLRSAVWGGATAARLTRVSAVDVDFPSETGIEAPVVAVFARLVVVGADGGRLHEEIMLAGREVPEQGRSRRLELEQPRLAPVRLAIESALDPAACRPAAERWLRPIADDWADLAPRLARDVTTRSTERLRRLENTLAARAVEEANRLRGLFDQMRETLKSALEGPGPIQRSFDDELLQEERSQVERDIEAWRHRLAGLDDERDGELALLANRYSVTRPLVFPVAVVVCVPTPLGGAR